MEVMIVVVAYMLILGVFFVWPMIVWLLKQCRVDGDKQIYPFVYLTVYTGFLIGYLILK